MSVRWISAADLTHPESVDADSAALAASWILYKLTAEKYPGIKTSTDFYRAESMDVMPIQYLEGGGTVSPGKHVNIYEVYDFTTKYLPLRSKPVLDIHEVQFQGRVINPDCYFIGNRAFLGRADGDVWDLASGVLVKYTHGILPPEPGLRAAKKLADELVLLIEDPDSCSLPDRVTSVNRQGLSFSILDPQDFLDDGRTGIYDIDLFLKAANPIRARKIPKVYSPDIPRGKRRT